MKKILFFNISLILFSFGLEKIIINKNKNGMKVVDIKYNIINYLKNGREIADYYEKIYALNPQNCQIRETNIGYRSCYTSLHYKNEDYYFCARIEEETATNKNKIDDYIEDIKIIFQDLKEIKIDCYNEKINYIKYFYLLMLFLL